LLTTVSVALVSLHLNCSTKALHLGLSGVSKATLNWGTA